MERKMKLTYGSEFCEEILSIVLEQGLTEARIETAAGDVVATMVHTTNMLLLEKGIAEPIKRGDSLFLVFNRIQVMGHLSALAQLAHVLFHNAELSVNNNTD